MKYREFEAELYGALGDMSAKEKIEIISYYEEMFSEKREMGMSEDEILREFGTPEECAKRVMNEISAEIDKNAEEEANTKEAQENPICGKKEKKAEENGKKVAARVTFSSIIGTILFTLLLAIPLAAVLFSIVVSFGAVAIVSAATTLAGVLYVIYCPITPLSGIAAQGIIAHIGVGIVAAGVGALLFAVFYLLTKYSAVLSYRLMIYIYRRK